MAIASVAPKNFIGNTNQHMVVIKTSSKEVSWYLANYLNLDITESLAKRRTTGGTRPALDYPALRSIPVLENINFDLLKEAEKQKHQKEQRAQELLAGIDDYLLNELDITLPKLDNSLKKRIFKTPSSEVISRRLDPDYSKLNYKILRQAVQQSKFKTVPLKNITSKLHAGKTPASTSYSDEKTNFPLIKVASYSGDFIDLEKVNYAHDAQPHQIKKGDIFILSAAHQPEYIGRHIKYLNNEPNVPISFVGELICVRSNQKSDPMFLFSMLSMDLFKTLINREKTGQTSHVYGKDLKWLSIPLPPIEKQREMTKYIENIRKQATQLQTEAEQVLAAAKAEVERIILGS